jgi:hypothetical protein
MKTGCYSCTYNGRQAKTTKDMPKPPPPQKKPINQPLSGSSSQGNPIKIQTIALAGLLVMAISAIGLHGLEHYREAQRARVIRASLCGAARGDLKSEAARLWEAWLSYKQDMGRGVDYVAQARSKLIAMHEPLQSLTSEKLRAVENYCDPAEVEAETNAVKTNYPGLTAW